MNIIKILYLNVYSYWMNNRIIASLTFQTMETQSENSIDSISMKGFNWYWYAL